MADLTSVLNTINAIGVLKPTEKLANLEEKSIHKLLSIQALKTRYGRAIKVEMESYFVFLPARFTQMDDSTIEQLNAGIRDISLHIGQHMYDGSGKYITSTIDFV